MDEIYSIESIVHNVLAVIVMGCHGCTTDLSALRLSHCCHSSPITLIVVDALTHLFATALTT